MDLRANINVQCGPLVALYLALLIVTLVTLHIEMGTGFNLECPYFGLDVALKSSFSQQDGTGLKEYDSKME